MIVNEILLLFECNHARWVDSDTALDAKRNDHDVFCNRCNVVRPVKRFLKRRTRRI